MPKTTYPAAADLEARLEAAGIDPDVIADLRDAAVLEDAVADAVAEWEKATDWGGKYLADPAPTTRAFDPPVSLGAWGQTAARPGSRLVLSPPVLSVSAVSVAGTPLRQGTGFVPRPDNAPAEGRAYQWLDFLAPLPSTAPGAISVTARFGASAEIPDDVWNAILGSALARLAPEMEIGVAQSGGGGWKLGPIEEKSGVGEFAKAVAAAPARFDRAVSRHRRVAF